MKYFLIIITVSCISVQVYGKPAGLDSLRQTNELKELVVKSYRLLTTRKGNREIFLATNLTHTEGMQGMDLMAYVPGLSVNAQEKILLKGKEPQVYLNDRKLEGNEVNALLKSLPAKDIARIEVSHNRNAADDGDTENGSVYIYTKKDAGFSWTTQMQGQLREWNDYGYFPGTSVNYGGNHWNIYGSYNYYQFTGHNKTLTTSGIASPEGHQLLFHQDDFNSDYLLKEMDYRIGTILTPGKNKKHTLGAEFSGTRDARFHFVNTNRLWRKDYEKQLEGHGINHMTNEKPSFTCTAALSWKWTPDSSGSYVRIMGNFFRMRSHGNSTQEAVYEQTDEWNSDETDITRSDTKNINIQADLLKAIRKWKLQSGLKYIRTKRDNHSIYFLPGNTTQYVINYHEQIAAGYFSINYNSRHIDLTAGTRMECTDTKYREEGGKETAHKYLNMLPDFSLMHHLSDDWSYELTYNMALTRPSFTNLSNGTVRYNDYSYSIGNPDLKAFTKHKAGLDLNWKQHTLSLEYDQAKDIITFMVVKANDKGMYEQYRNAGRYRKWNISYNFTGNVFSWWNLNLFAQVSHLNFPLNYRYTRQWTGLINVNSRFISGKCSTLSLNVQSAIGNLTANSRMTHNYTIVGLTYSYSPEKRWNIQLSINDLFHGFRQDYTDSYPAYTITTHSTFPTRILSLRLTYTFLGKRQIQEKNIDKDNSIRNRM